jgi:hypothetical protein
MTWSTVQEHALSESALPVHNASCCSATNTACGCGTTSDNKNVFTSDLYALAKLAELPSTAVLASLGCGNATVLTELQPRERVPGSDGAIDELLSARRQVRFDPGLRGAVLSDAHYKSAP